MTFRLGVQHGSGLTTAQDDGASTALATTRLSTMPTWLVTPASGKTFSSRHYILSQIITVTEV